MGKTLKAKEKIRESSIPHELKYLSPNLEKIELS